MHCKTIAIALVMFVAVAICDADDIFEEISLTDGFIGVGARAMAMGGAHIALAQDFSACYYNPAGLAYVYKQEISGALSLRNGSNETTLNSSALQRDTFTMAKLAEMGFVMPMSAKRGGAAFAMGYSRHQSFDYSSRFYGARSDGTNIDAYETSNGGIGAFHIAGAVQASKLVAIGTSLEILFGAENYTWDAKLSEFGDTTIIDSMLSDKIINDYSGATMRMGMTFIPTNFLTIGLMIKLPSMIIYDQEYIQETEVHYTDSDDSYEEIYVTEDDIELSTPFQFGGGLALRTPLVNIAGDAVYTDWRQTRYHSSYLVEQNPWIPDSLNAVFSWGIGAEFTVPIKFLPTRIRAGYRYDPLPRKCDDIEKQRQAITGGIAFLIDKSWILEASVAMSNWEKTTRSAAGEIGENFKVNDIYMALAYRF